MPSTTTLPALPDPDAPPATVEAFRGALPASLKGSVNVEVAQRIVDRLNDPDQAESYRDHLLGYVSVMRDGRFRVANYIDAVAYIAHKVRGLSNLDAFSAVFPGKIQDWANRMVASKDVASYVTAYNKSKLVAMLYEQTLVPSWVLNQDVYQKAINVQADLMENAKSEKVRVDAANSLLTHLKPPEAQKLEVAIVAPENSAVAALRATTQALVDQQKLMLAAGQVTPSELGAAPIRIIEHAPLVDDDPDDDPDDAPDDDDDDGGTPAQEEPVPVPAPAPIPDTPPVFAQPKSIFD